MRALADRTAVAWKGWDLYVALIVAGAAAACGTSARVRDSGVTLLLAEGALGFAVLGVVLSALAILAPTIDGYYRRVLEAAGGIDSALAPFKLTAALGGLSTVAGLGSALAWPILSATPQLVALGLSTLLAVWAVAGTVSLVSMVLFHASQRAQLLGGVEQAEEIRARRVGGRAPGTTRSH